MKSIVRNLKLTLIRKFEYFVTFEVCVGMFIICQIIYCTYAFFWRTKILEVLFWYVPCHASTPYDKYGWISEVYNVLRIVSGRKRFSLYKSTIYFATFIDISVIWFTKFNFLSICMPKNLVTEVSLIVLLPNWYRWNLHFYYKRTACTWFYLH